MHINKHNSLLNPNAKCFFPSGLTPSKEAMLHCLSTPGTTPQQLGITCDNENKRLIELSKQTDPISLSIMYILLAKFKFKLPSQATIYFQTSINFIYNKKDRSEFDLCILAKMYLTGTAFKVNYDAAAAFYEKAIKLYDSKKAMIGLACMLVKGQTGVLPDETPNLKRAKELYERASDDKLAQAMLEKLNTRLEKDTWPVLR